jgi:hypothetical protein
MNRLAAETSPYILQHADNPVDWYPVGRGGYSATPPRCGSRRTGGVVSWACAGPRSLSHSNKDDGL